MTPTARRNTGLGLGLVLVLVILAGLYFSGLVSLPFSKAAPKPLCYVSPKNPNFIKEAPGKDPEGNDLVPVYPTGTPGQAAPPALAPQTAQAPQAERKIKFWHCPMHPEVVKNSPGKCPKCGMDLVPVYEEGPAPAPAAKGERKIKYWVSPMDPGYVRDKPGKAPCGMDLVPVYEEEGGAAASGGVIAVSPAAVQSMGVRTAKVEVKPLSRDTWTVGLVTLNERSLAVVNAKVSGWVERLYINATGDPVRKGQTLLTIYSPELVSTQDEYLLALKNLKVMQKSSIPDLAEGAQRLAAASRRRLQLFDITPAQITELEQTGKVRKTLALVSPANGIVMKRMVTQGAYVQSGMPLLEVADLSTIWVDADVYQYELPWIKAGQPVEMTLDYLPGEAFPGKIDYIYPYFKEATRTAKVRLRFPNPNLKLKPDMFASVKIASPVTHQAVVVPTEAVLDTGLKQHVFIALGQGRFEPREVKLGVYGNDNHYREVLSGLTGGEEIVTSAQFLLDSESRFREAVQMMMPGMDMGGKKPEEKPAMAPMPGMTMEGPKEAPPAVMPPGHKH